MLDDVGRTEEAVELWRACVPELSRILGPEHPFTVAARTDLQRASGSP